MEPHLLQNDKMMFYSYLDQTSVYFEYGSGGSTYQASVRDNITKIYSVESDIEWQTKLKENIKRDDIVYIFNDMDTAPNQWGNPGKQATNEQKINYSSHILKLTKSDQEEIDIVFIDGRFRVACCLKCFDVISQKCLVAFDDFLNRPQYHIVLDYFDIVEKSIDNRMVILRKKDNCSIPPGMIAKYEIIKD